MDSVLRLFLSLPSQLEIVFGCFLLGLGIGVGLLLGRGFKKAVPQKYEVMVSALVCLETELKKTDQAVALLWATRLPPDSREVSSDAIKTEPINAIATLTVRLINTKNTLESLRKNILGVLPWIDDKQRSFSADRTADSAMTPTIGHRAREYRYFDPNDPSKDVSTFGAPWKVSNPDPSKSSSAPDFGLQSETRKPLHPREILKEIVELYNRAVDDPLARDRFREDYPPIRIGTVNAVERRQNPTLKPEIKETTDGDFFAFPVAGRDEYAVFPRLGLTIEAVSYSAGAMGEVFGKTQGHNSTLFYSRYRVKQPAIFRREGETWTLRESGELELGIGE